MWGRLLVCLTATAWLAVLVFWDCDGLRTVYAIQAAASIVYIAIFGTSLSVFKSGTRFQGEFF